MGTGIKITRRIFIQEAGNYHKLCGVLHDQDKYGESFIKLMFPALQGIALHSKKKIQVGASMTYVLKNGFHEFSYHYEGGVSHLKDATDRIDQRKGLPSTATITTIRLLRLRIYNLSRFGPYTKKLNPKDLVLKDTFTGVPRDMNFILKSNTVNEIRVHSDKGVVPLNAYTLPLSTNFSMMLTDAEDSLLKNPGGTIEIFRPDDPASILKPPTTKGDVK